MADAFGVNLMVIIHHKKRELKTHIYHHLNKKYPNSPVAITIAVGIVTIEPSATSQQLPMPQDRCQWEVKGMSKYEATPRLKYV